MLERISLASSSSCTSSTGLQALSRGIFSTGFYDDFFCGVGQVLIELFTDWTYGQSVGEGGGAGGAPKRYGQSATQKQRTATGSIAGVKF